MEKKFYDLHFAAFCGETNTPSKTPMATTTKLDKDEQGINVNIKLYRSLIGSLFYLTANRPNIMFSVCLCARF